MAFDLSPSTLFWVASFWWHDPLHGPTLVSDSLLINCESAKCCVERIIGGVCCLIEIHGQSTLILLLLHLLIEGTCIDSVLMGMQACLSLSLEYWGNVSCSYWLVFVKRASSSPLFFEFVSAFFAKILNFGVSAELTGRCTQFPLFGITKRPLVINDLPHELIWGPSIIDICLSISKHVLKRVFRGIGPLVSFLYLTELLIKHATKGHEALAY